MDFNFLLFLNATIRNRCSYFRQAFYIRSHLNNKEVGIHESVFTDTTASSMPRKNYHNAENQLLLLTWVAVGDGWWLSTETL